MKKNNPKVKQNRKTLKNRIYRMVSMLNFFSLFVMLFTFMITFWFVLNIASGYIADSVLSQMSYQLEKEWTNKITDKKLPATFSMTDSNKKEYYDLFIKLGDSYKILRGSPGEHFTEPKNAAQMKEDTYIMRISKISAVEYKIKVEDKNINTTNSTKTTNTTKYKVVFDSTKGNPNIQRKLNSNDDIMKNILDTTKSVSSVLFDSQREIKVKDKNNKELAVINVNINTQVILGAYLALLVISSIIFLLTLFVSRMGIRALSNIIVKPLLDLEIKMNQIASGELEAAMNTGIVLKKPVREVESLADASNKIMSRMHTFVGALANQKLELEAQNINLQENSSSLETMNEALAHRNTKLKNILDNVEQGFFTFKRDLIIYSEYSLFCEKIFDSYLNNRKLSALLYPDNISMQHFVDELFVKIFEANHNERRKFIPLLPEELTINGCDINISYKVVLDEKDEENIMVIITDITEKRLLEKRMDEERKTLKMVVKSIINRSEFLDLVREYEDFTRHEYNNFSTEEYEHFLRQIHTFKGNFSQYDMVTLVPKLNELEDKLYKYGTEYNGMEINYDEFREWLNEDLEIITSYAGKDFTEEGEYCYIKKEKLLEIEKKIQQTLTKQECKVILPMIKHLRYKSVKELLRIYPEYVSKLSERLGKSIEPIEITGDEVMVDTNYYAKVIKALSHIFRNCIDHGIETEDERMENGKEQIGHILCEVNKLENSFEIVISDDGKGIDLHKLEQKVIEEGLYSKAEWDKMSIDQKNNMIFEQGITTKNEATFVSGRGVGMAAVKECLSEIGGRIVVESNEGIGTCFRVILPMHDGINEMEVDADKFIAELVETSKGIIFKNTGFEFKPGLIKSENTIVLSNITALISLTGTLNSLIMISVNTPMAYELAKGFLVEKVEDEEITNYAEDVLAEISNTVLGNTFVKFENTKAIFHIGLPAVLSNKEAYVKYTQSQILSCNLFYEEYEFKVNMLIVDDEIDIDDLKEVL